MDLHNLKKRLQAHFSDGLITIVGSGLSCAETLPGMNALASHLQANVGKELAEDDLNTWNELIPLISKKGLEAALLEKAPTSNIEVAISTATAELISANEKRVISEVFNNGRKLRFTRLVKHLIKPSSGLVVVTTNYDRLVEVAVEEAGIGADTMFFGRFSGVLSERESKLSFCRDVKIRGRNVNYVYKQRALICKPHGSLDWYIRDGRPVCYGGDLSGVPRLIITPGQNKFRNGYESPFDHHRSKANSAIDKASRFLILGYGFNDDHLETHLTPAIKSGIPTLMITYELLPRAASLAFELSNVIAVDYYCHAGVSGTRVVINKSELLFPGINIWDINSFVQEVLEP